MITKVSSSIFIFALSIFTLFTISLVLYTNDRRIAEQFVSRDGSCLPQQPEERHDNTSMPTINVLIPHFHNERWLVSCTTALLKRATHPGMISIHIYDMGSDLNLTEVLPASVHVKSYANSGIGGSALPPFFQDSLSISASDITVLCDSDTIVLYQGWDEALIQIFHNNSFVAAGISPRGLDSGPHIISHYHSRSSEDCFDHSLEWNWLAVRSSFYRSRIKHLLTDNTNEKYCDWGSWFVQKATQDNKLAFRFMKVDVNVVEKKSPRVVQHPDGRLWAVHMFYGSRGRLDLAPDSPERAYILTEDEATYIRNWALWDGQSNDITIDGDKTAACDPKPQQQEKQQEKRRTINISSMPSIKVFQHVFVCHKHRVMVCVPPKSGSSEMKRWTMRACNHPVEDLLTPHALHGILLYELILTNKTLAQEVLESYFLFAVVRDPWQRLVSGFQDKFNPEAVDQTWAQYVIERYRPASEQDREPPVRWNEFLDYVVSTPDEMDSVEHRFEHFSSQSWSCPGWLQFDYIVRFESLEVDMNLIQRSVNVPPETWQHRSPDLIPGPNNPTFRQTYNYFHHSCSNTSAISQRYADDIKNFGYQPPLCEDN